MKKIKEFLLKTFPSLKTRQFKAGGYSFVSGAIVLTILIVINVLVSYIPASSTQFDMSSAHLYSITSQSKVVVNALEKDVDIYWICQAGEEDDVIESLLNKYDSLSEHLNVIRKDPDIYPTFASQYTSSTVYNNSIIVECEDKYRYIDYNDIYVASGTAYASYYEDITYSFDGEGAITSAIDYVVSEDLPKIYFLQGHGESELSSTVLKSIEKENYEYDSLSLLNEEVPEDCDILMIYAPTSDISDIEKDYLIDYVNEGGHLLICAGPVQDTTLTNLNAVLENYAVQVNEGIVIENDYNYYAFNMPYLLMPDINSDIDITSEIASEGYHILMPICNGYTINSNSSYTITSLLDSSSTSFSKIEGYNLNTYEKEDDDIDGSFALAVLIESNSNDGKIVCFGSSLFLDDAYVSYSSGANEDLILNSLAYMSNDDNAAISIRPKSLSYDYLTISSSTSTYLKILMVGIIPLAYLISGVDTIIRRRKK